MQALSKKYKGYSITQAAEQGGKSFFTLFKEKKGAGPYIALHLAALSRFLNLKSGLTDEHIEFIIDKLETDEEYMHLNLADLSVFIDRIKTNRYGNFYENFSATKFFECLNLYCQERTEAIIQRRIEENNSYRANHVPTNTNLPYRLVAEEQPDGGKRMKCVVDEAYLRKDEHRRQRLENINKEEEQKRVFHARVEQIRQERGCTLMEAVEQAKEEGL